MGAKQRRNFTRARKRATSSGRRETTKDDVEPASVERTGFESAEGIQAALIEIIERERTNLRRACALLDCLRIAAMYDHEEEIEPGDVAHVVSGLVSDTMNALDRVELRKAARQYSPELP